MNPLVPKSFRAKLLVIGVTTSLAFAVLTIIGLATATRVSEQLALVQQRYVPKMQIGPLLESRLEGIRRGFQDAVAAQEFDGLAPTRALKKQFADGVVQAKGTIQPELASALREAVDDYYATAYELSRRLIAGDTGEDVVDAMADMQVRYTRAADLLKRATTFDHTELAASFARTAQIQDSATRTSLFVSALCLVLVLLLSVWLTRSLLQSLAELAGGLERFGKGEFSQPIHVRSHDELGRLAEQANQMAHSLHSLIDERDRADWLKGGYAGLVHELRGELAPQAVANRSAAFLARYLGAPAAALYLFVSDDELALFGHHAGSFSDAAENRRRFRKGEGLVGQAAQQQELMIVSDLPPDYLRVRSGLGESRSSSVALLPLIHFGKVTGVLEVATFKPWSAPASELLNAVRETLSIAIEAARGHAAIRDLLEETQRQARRLAAQEDEVRAANEELSVQQDELRSTNAALLGQTRELQGHRQVMEQHNTELDEARRGLERKAEELTSVSAYKSQFLANMSHELRTPLNSMLLLSDLLSENESGNLTSKQVEYCKTIFGAGKDLLSLINQVLDLAKVESGRQELQIEAVELKELLDYAERMFGPVARDKGLEFISERAPGLPTSILTDRQRVEQVLANLLGNAIKFTERGSVALRIGKVPASAQLERAELRGEASLAFVVSDTGIGIAPENHERIFAPFEQVDGRIDRRYGGTGLGLTIARELIFRLGAELHVRSAPGHGSTFSCFVPIAGPKVVVDPLDQAATSLRQAGVFPVKALVSESSAPVNDAAVPGPGYLLVIEDDAVFAGSLAEIIRGQGVEFRIAVDGASGLALAKQHKPAGIILDVKLRDIDGWTVMEKLRSDAATANIPVHFVSGLEGAERGLAMGAVGFLTKPATHRDLVRVVEALVPSTAAHCRILIVEDDVDMADSLVELLQSESIGALGATNAHQAIEAMTREHFDCMILDLGLPDVDGLDLLASLQEQAASEMPPIVVYTGRALSKAEAQRLEAYTEAVVIKGAAGAERLVDEIRLFARRLKDGLPAKRRSAPPRHSEHVPLQGRKILIADDDMRTVYALSAMLRAKGLEVLVADTGQAALDVLDQHPDVQVVLMDIMMPEMDGYEAIRRMRKDARFAALPVIAVTAKAMLGDREKSMEAGASDYLAKPIEADRLLTMLRVHLAAQPQHAV